MPFDLSISTVTSWLNDTPFTPSDATDDQRARKRRRSSERSKCLGRRYPASPSPSQARSVSHSRDFMMAATPPRPRGKRPAVDDETPRAGSAGGSSMNLVSDRVSLTSKSDAVESHDSKRSRRSTSPSKRFPLYGPGSHALVRVFVGGAATGLSPTLRLLVGDMEDVGMGHGIMPRRAKAALERRLMHTASSTRLHDYMFYNEAWPDAANPDEAWLYMAGGEELVRRASRITDRTRDCSSMLSDELAWNNLVHSPVLDMLVHDMQDASGQDVLHFLPCMTTNIDPAYHRFASPTSRVDYTMYFRPCADPAQEALEGPKMLNWTTDQQLQQYALAVAIETKRYDGDTVKGIQQLGIWHAAQWDFLTSCAGAEAVDTLAFLPGVFVQGHTWSLVITTRRQTTTTVMDFGAFGNTGSVLGVFKVIAGLRRLRNWSLDVLWPWYKQHLPGLKPDED